jgi:WD40 repeat protein
VVVWSATPGEACTVSPGCNAAASVLAFSPDSRCLVSGCLGKTGARVWDATTGETLVVYPEHTAPVVAAAWSTDGTHAASGGMDGGMRIWEAESGRCVTTFAPGMMPAPSTLAFSPDGHLLARVFAGPTLQVLAASSGVVVASFALEAIEDPRLFWSPVGPWLLTVQDSGEQLTRHFAGERGVEISRIEPLT